MQEEYWDPKDQPANDYEQVDRLTDAWKTLEDQIANVVVIRQPGGLSIERRGRLRICYLGKPIGDCKAAEKAEAADPERIKELLDARLLVVKKIDEAARKAADYLHTIINKHLMEDGGA